MKLLDGVKADATLSPCGAYRYSLTRTWRSRFTGRVLWVMLNPSTADAEEDDPTIRRCQAFAREWNYDGITVVNLLALRATDPAELLRHPDPVGPVNDEIIQTFATDPRVTCIVAAWGAHKAVGNRGLIVGRHLAEAGQVQCLGTTGAARPKHPLYVKGDTPLRPWGVFT